MAREPGPYQAELVACPVKSRKNAKQVCKIASLDTGKNYKPTAYDHTTMNTPVLV